MMNCTGETLDTLHVSMQAALSQAAWGRLAAIGKSRTVKWRQTSDQTGHSSHISDLCPRQSLRRLVFKYATWNHQADSRWELQFGDASSKSGLFYI